MNSFHQASLISLQEPTVPTSRCTTPKALPQSSNPSPIIQPTKLSAATNHRPIRPNNVPRLNTTPRTSPRQLHADLSPAEKPAHYLNACTSPASATHLRCAGSPKPNLTRSNAFAVPTSSPNAGTIGILAMLFYVDHKTWVARLLDAPTTHRELAKYNTSRNTGER